MRFSLLPSAAPALIVLLLLLLVSSHAVTPVNADLALAATTTIVPITSFSSLVSACTAMTTNSTPEAMYGTEVKSYVDNYMSANNATEAYVAAYFTADVGWYWQVTQLGETSTLSVSAEDFVGGVLPDGNTGTYALYNATAQKLQAVDGKTDYKVLCYDERAHAQKKKKDFPWWAILIIVLGSAVIIAVVVTIVVCCCCCRKTTYTDDEDEAAFRSRDGSFSSRCTSHGGSSSTFSSRGSSHSGTSKSSGVAGSTTDSDSHLSASSSAASSSRGSR